MEWLKDFGVIDFGYTEESVPRTLRHYNSWLDEKKHFPLTYLEGERAERRQDVKNYWAETEASLVFLFPYHQSHLILKKFYNTSANWNGLKIASYTLGFKGMDYHDILRERLIGIGERLKQDFGLDYKLTLDTHPVLDRDMAYRAGLGWFGKNSMMINREHGSFFLIGSLLINKKLEIEIKKIDTDHCGQCTRCIDACPTSAIIPETRTINSYDCISTYTIEQFKPESMASDKMSLQSGYIFGCDICQDVCPWNKRNDRKYSAHENEADSKQQAIINFFVGRPIEELKTELESISGKEFERRFKGTSFSRSGKRGVLKNIIFYLKEKLDILS